MTRQVVGVVGLKASVDQTVVSQEVRVHSFREQPTAVHIGVLRLAHGREGLVDVLASVFIQAIGLEGVR